jgi:bifunctional NMN adenylyltransferase/nudix hydrolase
MTWQDNVIERTSGSRITNASYEQGFYCGRFQHIHIGHQQVIDIGLQMCKKFLIVVGSAQEIHTERNPFRVEFRIELINEIYKEEIASGRLVVMGLKDLTNENDITTEWGRYLLNHVTEALGGIPDVMIYGIDEGREGWFDPEDIKHMSRLLIPRSIIGISATELRMAALRGDFGYWKQYVDPRIHNKFSTIQSNLINISYYKEAMKHG